MLFLFIIAAHCCIFKQSSSLHLQLSSAAFIAALYLFHSIILAFMDEAVNFVPDSGDKFVPNNGELQNIHSAYRFKGKGKGSHLT